MAISLNPYSPNRGGSAQGARARFAPYSANSYNPRDSYGVAGFAGAGPSHTGGGRVNTLGYVPRSDQGWMYTSAYTAPGDLPHGTMFDNSGRRLGQAIAPGFVQPQFRERPGTFGSSNYRALSQDYSAQGGMSATGVRPILRAGNAAQFSSGTLNTMAAQIKSFASPNTINKMQDMVRFGDNFAKAMDWSSQLGRSMGKWNTSTSISASGDVSRNWFHNRESNRRPGPTLPPFRGGTPTPGRMVSTMQQQTSLRSTPWTQSHGIVDSYQRHRSPQTNFFDSYIADTSAGLRHDMLGQRSMGYRDIGDRDTLNRSVSGISAPGRVRVSFGKSGGGGISWSGGGFSY